MQYNKFEFNEAQYGPYPAKVSNDRVTDEHAPVTVLAAGDPLLNTPEQDHRRGMERVGPGARPVFPRRRPRLAVPELLQIEDPFPVEQGREEGALVAATYGKGRWVYVGLGLWRELPAGVDGAYQLLANMISLGKPATPAAPAMTSAPARAPGR